MKRTVEATDVVAGLKRQLDAGGAFDNHMFETAGLVVDNEGVKLLRNDEQLLVIFSNSQVFELTVRELK